MRKDIFPLFYIVTCLALVLSACNLPVNSATAEAAASPTEPPTATVDLAATQTRQAELLPTETPTVTATETLQLEPSATSTPEAPKARVVRETNCRSGPGGMYDLIATYQVDQILEVVAKDLGGGYWFVKNPKTPEEQCYLLAQNIKIDGDTSLLPKFTPQPSPTAMPYFEASFRKFDNCKGLPFAAFTVENTGSVEFRSVYIKVTDVKVNKSVETANNAFDQHNGCILVKNIAPLEPGASGYVETPPFTWQPQGHKLRVTLMLCTQQDLKGTCVTQSQDVKP